MSTQLQVYLGPYLKCRVGQTETTSRRRACHTPGCPKETISRQSDARFCEHCGKPVETRDVPCITSRVDACEATVQIREVLHVFEEDAARLACWMPNVRRDPPRDFYVNGEGSIDCLVERHVPDLESECEWFSTAYAAEIDVLRGSYGNSNVSLAWGLVTYIN